MAAGIFASSPAVAASVTWTGSSDGNWFNVGNWSPNQIPTTADDVVIDLNGTISAAGGTSIAFATLTLGDSSANFTPTLRLSAAESTSGSVVVSSGATIQQDTNQQISFGALTVQPGGSLTHTANSSARTAILNLSVSGNFDLQAGAAITLNARGYAGGSGPQGGFGTGAGAYGGGSGAGGGAHGGAGGQGNAGTAGGTANDSVTNPTDLGSGGSGEYPDALGGSGGGAALITVGGTFSLNGTINANGGNGALSSQSYASGGGAGGTVNISAASLSGTGAVRANGGAGATGSNASGGGGSGGRISIVATGADSSSLTLQAGNGNGGSGAKSGAAGTVARKGPGASFYSLTIGDPSFTPQSTTPLTGSAPTFANLTINNAVVNFDAGSAATVAAMVVTGTTTVTGATLASDSMEVSSGAILQLNVQSTGGNLQVDGGGTFRQMNAVQLAFTAVTVQSGGVITHAANAGSRAAIVNLSVSGNFDLQSGAAVSLSGLGYAGGSGPNGGFGTGPGAYGGGSGAGGGAHAGSGGRGNAGTAGGTAYDSPTNPTDLGSGGSGEYPDALGGNGGGTAVITVGGTFSLNGAIRANGGNGALSSQSYASGGGAGGAVNITAVSFSGTGSVSVNGGAGASGGNASGGGGGGGFIAISVPGTDSSNLTLQAVSGNGGGSGALSGGAGVIANKQPSASLYSLTIGDPTSTPQSPTPITGAALALSNLTINNAAVSFAAGSTVTANSLVVSGTTTLTAATLSPSALEVTNGAVLLLTAQATSGSLQIDGGGTFEQMNTAQLGFSAVTVLPGGVLTHNANGGSRAAVLNLNVSGNMDLQAGSAIALNGLGYAAGNGTQNGFGPGAGTYGGDGGGAGHGGAGGRGSSGAAGGAGNDGITNPADLGSGGAGAYSIIGGAGGGAALITVGGTLSLNGTISASGLSGTRSPQDYGAGGGAGGTVNIVVATLSGSGSIFANGGTGAAGGNNRGGGGGGGRIALAVTGADTSSLTVRADGATSGGSGAFSGGSGVIARKGPGASLFSLVIGNPSFTPQSITPITGNAPTFANVTINNSIVNFDAGSTATVAAMVVVGTTSLTAATLSPNALEVSNGAVLQLTAQSTSGSLQVDGGGTFEQMNTAQLGFSGVTVLPGGALTHNANGSSRAAVLNLYVNGDLDLRAGAAIALSGQGYAAGNGTQNGFGPGGGVYSGDGGGAGHGGAGGHGSSGAAGGAGNDGITNPADLGSGGSGAYSIIGGAGGGAALIAVTGTLTLNGTVSANGLSGTHSPQDYGSGGGAGGTVNITAATLSGAGAVSANGGAGAIGGNNRGGGGGGGRIAIVVTGTDSSSLAVQANSGNNGGSGATAGGSGVIARKGPSASLYGLTIGDSSTLSQSPTPLSGAAPTFANATINNSIVNFDAGSTATISALVVAGTTSLTAATLSPSALEVSNGAVLQLTAQATGGSLQVDSGGTFEQMNTAQLGFTAVTVMSGGVLTHNVNGGSRAAVLNLNVAGNVDLQAGAAIALSGQGYAAGGSQQNGFGPGAGTYNGDGGGAGHGGAGGHGSSGASGGAANDATTNPADLGSGGAGSAYINGGAGGGAVLITAGGGFSLNGTINVNGLNGVHSPQDYGSGGGAGGTVNIAAAAFNGTGAILANGGTGGAGGNNRGGGGGGGIVALTGCNSNLVSNGVSGGSAGGSGATAGGAGAFNSTVPSGCPSAPAAPTNLAVSSTSEDASGSTFVTATWSPVAQATSYTLQASTAANFSGSVFTGTSTVTTATVRGLAPNTTYFLEVAAFNNIGFSPFSASVTTLTPVDLTPPFAPTLLSAVGGPGGRVIVSWRASLTGEQTAFFNLYRATVAITGVSGLTSIELHATATYYSDTPVDDGTYYYGVTGLDPSFNESALSNTLSALSIHSGNAPITNLAAVFSPSQKNISLSWSAPSTGTVAGYNVYRSTYAAPLAGATLLQGGATTTSLVDSPSLSLDATYFYLATSLNLVGQESTASNLAPAVFDVHAPVIHLSGITDGQYTNRNAIPVISVTDFSPVVSTLTLNGQPFVSSTTIYSAPNQTVSEGGTASVSCAVGTIQSYTSVWATSCGNPTNCGTCPLGGTSCTMTYSNSTCGDVAPGCSKDGRLAINCGYTTTLTQPGTYFLALQVQDVFANASSATAHFTIDKASPSLIIQTPSPNLLTNQNVLVVYQSTDDFTPANQIVVKDGNGVLFASSTTITTEGAQTLTLTATDLAGNQATSSVTFLLDKTPPVAVTDLRVSSQNVAAGQVTLAWTSPHDALSGVAGYVVKAATYALTTANFNAAPTVLTSTTPLTEGATEHFVVSASTTQTVYFAQKSSDAAGNFSSLSNVVFWDHDGPVLSSLSPAPGSVVARPVAVTMQASDLTGVAQVVFSVDGVVLSTAVAPPYSFFWNTLAYADGAHTVVLNALDTLGNPSVTLLNYTLAYQPPSTPTITFPPNNYTTRDATVTVVGLAPLGTTVHILVDGFVLGSAPVSSTGTYQTSIFLPVQGTPLITVTAADAKGASSQSSPVAVNYNLAPPGGPLNFAAVSAPAGHVALSWTAPSGKTPSFYNVYRSTYSEAFSSSAVPSPVFLDRASVTAVGYDDVPPLDGIYYYGATSLDSSGDESGLSAVASAVSDRVLPAASLVFVGTTPPVGLGAWPLQLTLSKPLALAPLLLFTPAGQSPINVTLSPSSPTVWVGTLTVVNGMNSGSGTFSFQGTDYVGNVGTSLTSGGSAAIDLTAPVGSIVLTPASPEKAGSVALSLTFSKPVISTPTLSYVTASGSTVPVTLSGSGVSWTGTLTISSGTDGTASFVYSAVDGLGNVGTALSAGGSFLIETIPPTAPLFLRAAAQKGGEVDLSWSAPLNPGAATYNVYRDSVRISTGVAPQSGGSGAFVDFPADGTHIYAVSAVDAAGNEGTQSQPATIASKSTPPSSPVGTAASIDSFGHIEVAWQAGSPDSASFKIYRTTYSVSSVSGLFGLLASTPPFVDNPPLNALYSYYLVALDAPGNQSAPSAPATILWDRAPPQITINGVHEGAIDNFRPTPVFIATGSATSITLTATLNGSPFISGTNVSTEGDYTLSVNATNQSGASSTSTIHFTVDTTSPAVTLAGITPGSLSHVAVLPQVTVTDLHLSSVTLLLDGGAYAQSTPIGANGGHVFEVAAYDLAGNVTISTVAFTLALPLSAPSGFTFAATEGVGATLSWQTPSGSIAGYRVYRDGVQLTQGLLSGQQFQDSGFSIGAAHIYEVSAVDLSGQEGARAQISLPAATFQLASYGASQNGVQALTRGFFDTVQFQLNNNDAQSQLLGPISVQLVSSTATVFTGQTPSVLVPAGASAPAAAVVAVNPSISDAATLRVTVQLPSGLGTTATITRSFTVASRSPADPIVELYPGPMIFGTNTQVQVKFNNRGSAPLEIRTSVISDLSVQLATPQGTVLSQAMLNQTGNGAQVGPSAYYVSIGPGASFLFDPVSVFVPQALGTSALLSANVAQVFNSLESVPVQGSRNFSVSQAISGVTQPAYSATIAPDKTVYDQNSPVTLFGVTVDTSGALLAGATVQVGISVQGYTRSGSTVTNSAGRYSMIFNPTPTEAGVYTLWATNPSVVAQIPQSSFTIVGFGYQYTNFTATVVQNSTFPFQVGLINTGQTSLSGLIPTVTLISTATSGVTLVLDTTTIPTSLPGAQTATLNFKVQVDANAPLGSALFNVTVRESHGFVRTLPVTVVVAPSVAVPTLSPQAPQIGMNSGQTQTLVLTLSNSGTAPWTGVSIGIPTVDWITIQGNPDNTQPLSLGDIPAGGQAQITLAIDPPASLPSQSFALNPLLQVNSTNSSPIPLNALIVLTASAQGSVVYNIINADKPRDQFGNGVPVPGAQAQLTSLDIAGLSFSATADSNGVARFVDVPAGRYSIAFTASGFTNAADVETIQPGITNTHEILLLTETVTYNFTVTPTSIADQYSLVLSASFKTDVPAPAVVVTPTEFNFNLPNGGSADGQITFKNTGIISAFNVNTVPNINDPSIQITVPYPTIPELKPGQVVVVPFHVTLAHASCHTATLVNGFQYTCAAGKLVIQKTQDVIINAGLCIQLPFTNIGVSIDQTGVNIINTGSASSGGSGNTPVIVSGAAITKVVNNPVPPIPCSCKLSVSGPGQMLPGDVKNFSAALTHNCQSCTLTCDAGASWSTTGDLQLVQPVNGCNIQVTATGERGGIVAITRKALPTCSGQQKVTGCDPSISVTAGNAVTAVNGTPIPLQAAVPPGCSNPNFAWSTNGTGPSGSGSVGSGSGPGQNANNYTPGSTPGTPNVTVTNSNNNLSSPPIKITVVQASLSAIRPMSYGGEDNAYVCMSVSPPGSEPYIALNTEAGVTATLLPTNIHCPQGQDEIFVKSSKTAACNPTTNLSATLTTTGDSLAATAVPVMRPTSTRAMLHDVVKDCGNFTGDGPIGFNSVWDVTFQSADAPAGVTPIFNKLAATEQNALLPLPGNPGTCPGMGFTGNSTWPLIGPGGESQIRGFPPYVTPVFKDSSIIDFNRLCGGLNSTNMAGCGYYFDQTFAVGACPATAATTTTFQYDASSNLTVTRTDGDKPATP